MSKVKNWCFTAYDLEKWSSIDIQSIDTKNAIKYLIYQGEICPTTQRKHFQAYIQLHDRKEMTYIKKLFKDNTLHLEQARATPQINQEYCRKTEKDGIKQEIFKEPVEYGVIDYTVSGTRTDIQRIKEKIDNGDTLRNIQKTATGGEFELTLKYNRLLEEYAEDINQEKEMALVKETFIDYVFNEHQQLIKDIVEEELNTPNHRRVNWIYDRIGGIGKTHLARYFKTHYDTAYITGGQIKDISYHYKGQQLVIFDLSRTYADNLEHIYTSIEQLKNGMVLSTKYQVKEKIYSRPPIILVMANFKPNQTKLSKDRWNIKTIHQEDTHDEVNLDDYEIPIQKTY